MKKFAVLAGLCGLAVSAAACAPTSGFGGSVAPAASASASLKAPSGTTAYQCPVNGWTFTVTRLSDTSVQIAGPQVGDQLYIYVTTGEFANSYESTPFHLQYTAGEHVIMWDSGSGVDCYEV